jgi:hypothetical protein
VFEAAELGRKVSSAEYKRGLALAGSDPCHSSRPVRGRSTKSGLHQGPRWPVYERGPFAGLTPRKDHFVASFALHRSLKSPRAIRKQAYGPRWRLHFVPIRSVNYLDGELTAWLQESHDVVGMQEDR